MMLLCPYVSYLIAEGLKLSGIVSILTNGIFLQYYATPNISPAAKKVLKMGYETIAQSAETLVFLFLGIGLFAFNHPFDRMGFGLVFTTILNLNFARLLNVLIVTALVNTARTKNKIGPKMQAVMWVSGLRGAMAYALALKSVQDLDIGPVILIDTLIYAFITILGIGSILNPILSKLDVKRKEDIGFVGGEREEEVRQDICSRMKRHLQYFDNLYFSPLFIKDAKMIQRRNLEDDSFDEKKEEDDWYMIRSKQKPQLGQPFTANPEQMRDMETEQSDSNEESKRPNNEEGRNNQITEEFPPSKD